MLYHSLLCLLVYKISTHLKSYILLCFLFFFHLSGFSFLWSLRNNYAMYSHRELRQPVTYTVTINNRCSTSWRFDLVVSILLTVCNRAFNCTTWRLPSRWCICYPSRFYNYNMKHLFFYVKALQLIFVGL